MPEAHLSKPIILLCNTRTGSTAFGSALEASNGDIWFAGEVFHPDGLFVKWLEEHDVSALSFFLEKQRVLGEFLVDCSARYPNKALLIDVKYHDTLGLMPTPALYDFPPALLSAVRDLEGRVLHLKRKSRFDSAISQVMAGISKVHHVRVGESLPDFAAQLGQVVIDPLALARQIRHRIYHELIATRQLINSGCKYIDVYYEDIFVENESNALATLEAFLAFPVRLDKVVHRKIGAGYRDIIKDYESLRKDLRQLEEANWPISLLV